MSKYFYKVIGPRPVAQLRLSHRRITVRLIEIENNLTQSEIFYL